MQAGHTGVDRLGQQGQVSKPLGMRAHRNMPPGWFHVTSSLVRQRVSARRAAVPKLQSPDKTTVDVLEALALGDEFFQLHAACAI